MLAVGQRETTATGLIHARHPSPFFLTWQDATGVVVALIHATWPGSTPGPANFEARRRFRAPRRAEGEPPPRFFLLTRSITHDQRPPASLSQRSRVLV